MTRPVLILRPQPGADATAARAAASGLEAIVAPLFAIVARDWTPPESRWDALLVTSANAARAIDARTSRGDRVYAVGGATAAALAAAGFRDIVTGTGRVADIVRRAKADGVAALLHLAGADRTAFDPIGLRIETRIVYASETVPPPPAFDEGLRRGAVALLHSARAARRFHMLASPHHRVAALSRAVLDGAGSGWAATAIAARPDDEALLAAAAELCH